MLAIGLASVVVFAAAVPAAPRGDGAVVSIPGTRARIAPPEGFEPTTRFTGFVCEPLGASVIATELPAPFAEVGGAMTAKDLERKGLTLLTKERARVPGVEAVLLHVTQPTKGDVAEKWWLIAGDANETVMVVATFPQKLAKELSAPCRRCVESLRWDRDRVVDPLEGLPYTIAVPEGLKLARRVQSMLTFTLDGKIGPGPKPSVLFLVAPTPSGGAGVDLRAASEAFLAARDDVADPKIETSRALTIGGRAAWEIASHASEKNGGARVAEYQVLVDDGHGVVAILGRASAATEETLVPAFRDSARSFRLRGAQEKSRASVGGR